MFRQLFTAAALVFAVPSVMADFHEWRIEQVFSDASGKIQYIELGGAVSSGEGFLSGHAISTAGKSFTFRHDLPNQNTAGQSILLATAAYASQNGAVTPDYFLPDNFFATAGDTIDYAGVDSFTFTQPQLPGDGLQALNVDFTQAANQQKNFAGETGTIRVEVEPPSSIPLPPAVIPGLLVLGGMVAGQTWRSQVTVFA